MEFFQVGGFGLKIHFLLGYHPHFIQHLVKIHQAAGRGVFQQLAGLLQQHDIPAHDIMNALPLHLHHHPVAVLQDGGMGLSNGGAAQRLFIKGRKNLVQRTAVGFLHNGNHLVVGHRGHVAAQLL